jgi:hypothetical protein
MPRGWIVALILICIALNWAGFLWNLFEPIPLYDEIAHFLTPVVILAEIIYRGGAAGALAADRYLDRLFNRSRIDANRPRVR